MQSAPQPAAASSVSPVDAFLRAQFTTWQLAGDLFPDATRDQRIASGFNRRLSKLGFKEGYKF